jgi:hypothetical protein
VIILTSKAYDLIGLVIIREDAQNTQVDDTRRRVSMVATLDGGAVPVDGGYSDGDTELVIKTKTMARDDFLRVQRMEQLYGVQQCATHQGVFEGSILSLKVVKGSVAIRFLVSEKISG